VLSILGTMQAIIAPAKSARVSDRVRRQVVSIVAIHDDFAAGIRAREALQGLSHSLGSGFQIDFTLWSFGKLERLDLRALARRLGDSVRQTHVERLPDAWRCAGEHAVAVVASFFGSARDDRGHGRGETGSEAR
jgi:hypothetical protein